MFLIIKYCFPYIEVFNTQCLRRPDGVAYMAAKKYYFGVGGGTRRFLSLVEEDGELVLTCNYIHAGLLF